ncbi:MAG: ComF family protein [Candidatus Buchananbacteria bacterium]
MFDLKKTILDLIFPIYCLECRQVGAWVCRRCFEDIKSCAKWQENFLDNQHLSQVWSLFDYHQPIIAKILHAYKYEFITDLEKIISDILSQAVLSQDFAKQIKPEFVDLICPVPLSKKRRRWRGFNQSEILAEVVAKSFNLPVSDDILNRKFHTRAQVGLPAKLREINIKGIFQANSFSVLEKRILLVDDVLTTGATMKECARVLKEAGAKEVIGLVFAKG